jgi:signal transduction histidine kinase
MVVAVTVLAVLAAALIAIVVFALPRAFGRTRAAERTMEAVRAQVEEISERAASQAAALGSLGEGIVLLDADGAVAYSNPAARDLLGRRVDTVEEITPEPVRGAVQEASREARPVETEFETSGRTVHVTASPAPTPGEVVLVARDVTTARMIERIRRDFVANASHELKTPVASIQALAETLEEAVAQDPVRAERFLALLGNEANRLSRLVADLLDLSRLEAEPPERSLVHLETVVKDEVERLRARAEASGITLLLEAADAAPVYGSPGDLGLLVHNLLDNAIHYSPGGGQVRVRVDTEDGSALLIVSDTGIGIASRDLDRVFERFYRADPARSRETGGTGLGLSIVKHVAESLGGEVTVQSVLGAGSTFTVRLPRAEEEIPTPRPEPSAP